MIARTLLLALALLPACRTEKSEEPAGMALHQIARTMPKRAWNLVQDGEVLGTVVLFADPDAPNDPSRQFFSLRNPFQQELGVLDGLGRAWRYVPHRREPELVGTATVLEGARKILGGGAAAELEEVSIDSLKTTPASGRK